MTTSIHTTILLLTSLMSFAQHGRPIDRDATPETQSLFRNLMELSKNHTLFGHQHATEYGHGWVGDEGRSDVKSVCGSHPAVIGVDLLGFTGRSDEAIQGAKEAVGDRKSTRLNSSHVKISYAVFCVEKKNDRWIDV